MAFILRQIIKCLNVLSMPIQIVGRREYFTVTRFGPKVGQISPKWDKSGTFSDQISVHFGAGDID